ncbi:MAG: gliding motility-associated C-terminal domain-containing protein [Cyclobacteriaceae bacterium]|nr:gliding motility-associated C-terminal domain-containing protein [Cyclobacteriaceae bacterium]
MDSSPLTQQNRVSIYNRWGDLIFDIENYDNDTRVFAGLSNSGSELPSGTYYYKIEFTSGQPTINGFLSLKR